MFTGIVEETGKVLEFSPGALGWRLRIGARRAVEGIEIGDSIAVNGCCLTAVESGADRLGFDLLEETRRLTNFSTLKVGSAVNLERSLRFDGKVGGHFVTGHIDQLGKVERFETRGKDTYLKVAVGAGFGRYLIVKGSVAVDGVSLTIAEVDGDSFAVWLIPHTLVATRLGELKASEPVNIEFDLLGKYVEKLLTARTPEAPCAPH